MKRKGTKNFNSRPDGKVENGSTPFPTFPQALLLTKPDRSLAIKTGHLDYATDS